MDRIMDAIRADHLDLQSYYNRIVHAGSSAEGQNIFTWELARHVGEELVRYPVLPKHLHEDTAEDRRQHQSYHQDLILLCSYPSTVYNMPQLTEELEKVRGVKDERIESTNYKQSLESDKLLDPCLELDLEDPKIAPFTKAYEQLGRFIPL
ncbi:hypothetical protein N7470_005767 [Penicillium chermesinum]|nr:hypothetical protein N7470_005767 [Penicillium chermesinum]